MTTSLPTAVLEPGSPEWRRLITPSKIAAALGFSPWDSQYSMWHYMAGNVEILESDAMRRGTFHEGAILREFLHQHSELTLVPDGQLTRRINEWIAVTPDALVTAPDGVVELVEIKTTGDYEMEGWGEEGTDEIPEHYASQVIVAAFLLGIERINIYVCGPRWNYQGYRIVMDDDLRLLAEAALEQLHAFWLSVQHNEPPLLSADVASYETWTKVADPALGVGKVEVPAELGLELRALAAQEAAAKKALPPVRAQLVNYVEAAGARLATVDGEVVARRQKNSHGGVSLVAVQPKTPKTSKEPT